MGWGLPTSSLCGQDRSKGKAERSWQRDAGYCEEGQWGQSWMSQPRKAGCYVRANTINSFEIEKTCCKFGYFVFGNVALYVYIQFFNLT